MMAKLFETYEQFISMLRCSVCGEQLPKKTYNWNGILKLGQMHRVEAILWGALKDKDYVPEEIQKTLKFCWDREIVRDMRQDYVAEQILLAFGQKGIPFAPMKGLVLKKDYPLQHMRYMSDLDYYVKPSERRQIQICMEKLGAAVSGTDSGDVNYELPGQVQVEFHGRLLYRMDSTGVVSYSDWSRMKISENCLTEEGYALNLIGHIAYNIAHAGCGVRFVLDLWVYRHKHVQQPDWNLVMQQLKADGLDKIAENLINLSEYWFGNGKSSPLLEELGAFVLEGGLYGLAERETLSNAGLSHGKMNAIKSQVFRSKDEFVNRFPWLEGRSYLLPIAWGMRGVHSLKTHRKEIGKWIHQMAHTNQEEIVEHREQLRRFGLSLTE